MKVLLSLLGTVAISTSAVSSTLIVKPEPATQEIQTKNWKNSDITQENIEIQIQNLQKEYTKLSDNEKNRISQEMAKLPELNSNKISEYLNNSNINFIKNNQLAIETMYFLTMSINQISNYSSSMVQLSIDWNTFNTFLSLNFGDSNSYNPWASTYGPSKWWKLWEWGWRADFPEGLLNIMRLVKLVFSLYNGFDFKPVEKLLSSGKNVFDYLVNIKKHSDDKISVLYNLLSQANNDFKDSKFPFTDELYALFDDLINQLESGKDLPLSEITDSLEAIIRLAFGMTIEEIGEKYSNYLNITLDVLKLVNTLLDIINIALPGFGFIINFILNSLKSISNQMVDADSNHHGVYIKFQQFIIPLGFKTR